jgi:pilus assembly protein Flp/PilA
VPHNALAISRLHGHSSFFEVEVFTMKLHQILAAKAQKGVTMIEYALIAALIAIVAITALTSVGQSLLAKFTAIATSLK